MARLLLPILIGVVLYLWWRPPAGGWSSITRWIVPVGAVALALLYLRSPIDLLPDVGPVGLIDDLLVLVGAILLARRRLRTDAAGGAGQGKSAARDSRPHDSADPYAVLGLRRGASREEIARAYREQMKLYHPDRVNALGEDLQRVAHEKTLEIQKAYEQLRPN